MREGMLLIAVRASCAGRTKVLQTIRGQQQHEGGAVGSRELYRIADKNRNQSFLGTKDMR